MFGHPTCPTYMRRVGDGPLVTANQVAAAKEAKVDRFLELVQAERGYAPPASERFAALSFETYGAAGEPMARLFRGLIATWARTHHACESEVAVFRHKWRHRVSTAVQQRNAELMGFGAGAWSRRP